MVTDEPDENYRTTIIEIPLRMKMVARAMHWLAAAYP
jgi:hypothetical protein